MKVSELKQLIKEKSAKKVIWMYINDKIKLTSKQLDYVIEEKNNERNKI